jgi:hypothetical protein
MGIQVLGIAVVIYAAIWVAVIGCSQFFGPR